MKALLYILFALLFSATTATAQVGMGGKIQLCIEPSLSETAGKKWNVTACDGAQDSPFRKKVTCYFTSAKVAAQTVDALDTVRVNMPCPGGNVVVVWPHGAKINWDDMLEQEIKEFIQSELKPIQGLDAFNASLYPNPVSGNTIHIKDHSGIKDVSITDMQGSAMPAGAVDANGNLDIEKLKPGVYFITIVYSDGRRVVIKIVKEI